MNGVVWFGAVAIGMAMFGVADAHADHVDNHIWIETKSGGFILATEQALDQADRINAVTEGKYVGYYKPVCDAYVTYEYAQERSRTNYREGESVTRTWYTTENGEWPDRWIKPKTHTVNNAQVLDQRNDRCGTDDAAYYTNALNEDISNLNITSVSELKHDIYHECVCGYWYSNTIKDEYTYTILDLPRDRETPPDYQETVAAGVKGGFRVWSDINDITFTYTDSRLDADIIVQQQIGDGTAYGNAEMGCLFENDQCTIQLFTDVNVRNRQTLTNTHSIGWTIAHEFGHLIGLPHHIDPDHIMNTVHADDVRDYWEARNINVPRISEPTYEERMLGYTKPAGHTEGEVPRNAVQFANTEIVSEFIELLLATLLNAPQEDRFDLWFAITTEIQDRIDLFGLVYGN